MRLDSDLILGFGSFAATLALVPLVRRVAEDFNVTAQPRDDRLHTNPTPYLGGVAIILVAAAATPFVERWRGEAAVIIGGAVLLAIVGLLDDIRNLRPASRLAAETCAALAAATTGARVEIFGGPLDWVLTVVWLVGVTNAFNLVDNLDGAAGGIAASTAVGLAVTAGLGGQVLVGGLAAVVAGTCLAFLVYNWPPARIFMGDAGTLPLGYLLAVIALKLRFPVPHVASITAIVLFAAPALFDTTVVVISRAARHVPVYLGNTDHTSHRLLRLGLSTGAVATIITLVSAACATLGVVVGRGVVSAPPVAFPVGVIGVVLLIAILRLPATANTEIGNAAATERH
ncbi:MAG: UDP-GlcNAc:undecaprenyl-phosphate/decaprenyl-phosphate GlcNAc-phosphate transferase [Actinomycetota bacterium]